MDTCLHCQTAMVFRCGRLTCRNPSCVAGAMTIQPKLANVVKLDERRAPPNLGGLRDAPLDDAA